MANNSLATKPDEFDVCIIGGGAMGSSSAYHLSRYTGLRVVLLERGPIGGHDKGSSHGGSRITRRSDTDPLLAKMATTALDQWAILEKEFTGPGSLLRRCGSLDVGDPVQPAFSAMIDTFRWQKPDFEILTTEEIKQRWPVFTGLPEDWVGIYNAEGGVLIPDKVVPTLQSLAKQYGARLIGNAEVHNISVRRSDLERDNTNIISYDNGSCISAKHVIVAAGAWTSTLLYQSFGFQLPLDIWEISFAWYKLTEDGLAGMKDIPVWRAFGGSSRCYGFPADCEKSDMVKIAPHGHPDMNVFEHPSSRTAVPDPHYVEGTTAFAQKLFPKALIQGSDGVELEVSTCLYSVSRDSNFVIDWLDDSCNVLVLAGFSGSGFKHTPLVGKMAAEMVMASKDGKLVDRRSPASFPNIVPFSIRRSSLFTGNSNRLAKEHEIVRSSL